LFSRGFRLNPNQLDAKFKLVVLDDADLEPFWKQSSCELKIKHCLFVFLQTQILRIPYVEPEK
jgi:hypothetical protein